MVSHFIFIFFQFLFFFRCVEITKKKFNGKNKTKKNNLNASSRRASGKSDGAGGKGSGVRGQGLDPVGVGLCVTSEGKVTDGVAWRGGDGWGARAAVWREERETERRWEQKWRAGPS